MSTSSQLDNIISEISDLVDAESAHFSKTSIDGWKRLKDCIDKLQSDQALDDIAHEKRLIALRFLSRFAREKRTFATQVHREVKRILQRRTWQETYQSCRDLDFHGMELPDMDIVKSPDAELPSAQESNSPVFGGYMDKNPEDRLKSPDAELPSAQESKSSSVFGGYMDKNPEDRVKSPVSELSPESRNSFAAYLGYAASMTKSMLSRVTEKSSVASEAEPVDPRDDSQFVAHSGFLEPGDELLEFQGRMTVAEALRKASTLNGCVGFSMARSNPDTVYFKSAWNFQEDEDWVAFKCEENVIAKCEGTAVTNEAGLLATSSEALPPTDTIPKHPGSKNTNTIPDKAATSSEALPPTDTIPKHPGSKNTNTIPDKAAPSSDALPPTDTIPKHPGSKNSNIIPDSAISTLGIHGESIAQKETKQERPAFATPVTPAPSQGVSRPSAQPGKQKMPFAVKATACVGCWCCGALIFLSTIVLVVHGLFRYKGALRSEL
jgi:hypothetical protein